MSKLGLVEDKKFTDAMMACPFCGEGIEMRVELTSMWGSDFFTGLMDCDNCNLQMERTSDESDREDAIREFIKAWNTRHIAA